MTPTLVPGRTFAEMSVCGNFTCNAPTVFRVDNRQVTGRACAEHVAGVIAEIIQRYGGAVTVSVWPTPEAAAAAKTAAAIASAA